MIYMFCRNKVADYEKWHQEFVSHTPAHTEAGMKLIHLWREIDNKNNIFFVFEIESLEKAKSFISSPKAAETGEKFGVLEGEYHFVEGKSSVPNLFA